jgi:hypothetical protein
MSFQRREYYSSKTEVAISTDYCATEIGNDSSPRNMMLARQRSE